MTRVVNLYKDKFDVYIGRAGKGQDGFFGNPVRIGYACPECGTKHMDGGSTLPCYRAYFERRMRRDPEFRDRVEELKGKTMACFCAPKPCHGDVMQAYLDR